MMMTRSLPMKISLLSILFFYQSIAFASNETMFAIYCPEDVVVHCNDELWDLSIYGDAYVETYSGQQSAGTPEVTYNLSSCNTGYIYRTWTVEDYNWNIHTCTQTITVLSNQSFTEDNINWPNELYEVSGCNPDISPENLPHGYGAPTYDWVECSMVGVSYSDKVFTISPTCKKVVRKWQVMDWCQYDVNYSSGLWTWYQTIKISDQDSIPAPEFPDDIEINSYNCTDALVEVDPLIISSGICGDNYSITNNSPYAFEKGADISGIYPIGITKVKITVHFGCGGKSSKTVQVVVRDAKAPSVYCYAELITVLMPVDTDEDGEIDNGMVEVWAKDLDKGSAASCGNGPIKYSFSEDPEDDVLVFDCDHVGINEVRMYVTDRKGSQAFCKVNLMIQNNGGNIPNCDAPIQMPEDSISLFGNVTNIFNRKINNVSLSIEELNYTPTIIEQIDTSYELVEHSFINASGVEITYWINDTVYTSTYDTISNQQFMNKISDGNGYFSFDSCLIKGKDYLLAADMNDFSRNGIDQKDVKILEQYLDGKISFANPYLYDIADIDRNGNLDYRDLEILSSFVSKETNILNEDVSWLFYAYQGEDMYESNPNNFILEEINNVLHNVNFIGAKLGDLNNDANTDAPEDDIDFDLNGYNISAKTVDGLNVSPNPFLSRLNLQLNSAYEQNISLSLYSADGKEMSSIKKNITKGFNEFLIEVNSEYKGLVFYQLLNSNGELIYSGKLLKL